MHMMLVLCDDAAMRCNAVYEAVALRWSYCFPDWRFGTVQRPSARLPRRTSRSLAMPILSHPRRILLPEISCHRIDTSLIGIGGVHNEARSSSSTSNDHRGRCRGGNSTRAVSRVNSCPASVRSSAVKRQTCLEAALGVAHAPNAKRTEEQVEPVHQQIPQLAALPSISDPLSPAKAYSCTLTTASVLTR